MGRPAGFKLSEETRRKMSEARRCKRDANEAREKTEIERELEIEAYHKSNRANVIPMIKNPGVVDENHLTETITINCTKEIMKWNEHSAIWGLSQ